MSMYGDYIKERLGDEILETLWGFATYRYPDPDTVYIVDIYVTPKYRDQRVASQMADSIIEIAKAKGCTKAMGSVVPFLKGAASSMKVLLAYGMTPYSSTHECVLFRKDI